MRKISLLIGGAVVALAACSGGDKKTAANDDLKKELELASTSDGLGVGTGAVNPSTQIVSTIERTAPAPRAPAASARAPRHHRAPTHTVAPVETEAPATVTTPEPTPVATEPVAADPTPVSPRPTPQTASYPGGNAGTIGRGPDAGPSAGSVLGSILGAVIRGAVVGGMGGDTCDPRTDGRHGRGGARLPVGSTFPGGIVISRLGTVPR